MALSGNLKEFELPDIFQLIGQQKKTGRLVLQDGDRRAYAVFSQGEVIAAAAENGDIIAMLSRYLVRGKRYPQVKVNEFVNFCKGSAHIFADVLLRIQYVSQEELLTVAQMAVEDMACEMFQWRRGTYRFEPLASVADFAVSNVSMTADAITMEAMRRVDDLQRMQEVLPPRAVLAPTQATARILAAPSAPTPAAEPLRHLLQLLNGTRTVEEVAAASFLSRYRVREMLFQALQENHVALSQQPRSTAKKDREAFVEDKRETIHTTFAALATAIIIILAFFLGAHALPRMLFSDRFARSQLACNASRAAAVELKTRIASVQYGILFGKRLTSFRELIAQGLLGPNDINRTSPR